MKKIVYISIISHNQLSLIERNFSNFPKKIGNFEIKLSILDNTGQNELKKFCETEELFYFHDGVTRGFGANHNKMFSVISPKDYDIFLICNPDIIIKKEFINILNRFIDSNADLFAPAIYFDQSKSKIDNPDKNIPGFLNFCISFMSQNRLHYGTRRNRQSPQWLSGAFIIFKPASYRKLKGFDENFFMYCEDIDISYRGSLENMNIVYDNEYHVIHEAQMESRNILSKNIRWHIVSAFRFSLKHKKLFHLENIKKKRQGIAGPRKAD